MANDNILEALISLRNEGPKEPRYGICWNLAVGEGVNAYAWITKAAREWPELGEAEIIYPVEGDWEEYKRLGAYADVPTLWDPSTLNGARRLRFLDYLIARAENERSPHNGVRT